MSAVRPVKAAGIWKEELWIVGRSTLTCTQHLLVIPPSPTLATSGRLYRRPNVTRSERLPLRYPNHPGWLRDYSAAPDFSVASCWRLSGVRMLAVLDVDDVVNECAIGRVPQSPTHPHRGTVPHSPNLP